MKRFLSFFLFLAAWIVFILPAEASPEVGTIQPSPSYAWGEAAGWINLNPAEGGLIISDHGISGYAWSSRYGWINFNPSHSGQGVTNNGQGVLGGYAWISGGGWLNMSGVTIDNQGVFHGIAGESGSRAGRVSFDCSQCSVHTDWRPVSARAVGGGGGGPLPMPIQGTITATTPPAIDQPPTEPIVFPSSTEKPQLPPSDEGAITVPHDDSFKESLNKPLTVRPGESGTLIRELPDGGKVRINVLKGTAEIGFTTDVLTVPAELKNYDTNIQVLGDSFFDVVAYGLDKVPLKSFNAPLKISLPLPTGVEIGSEVGVYHFNELKGEWYRLDEAVFNNTSATFYTSDLGRFAILSAPGRPKIIKAVSASSGQSIPWWPPVAGAAGLAGIWYLLRHFKR